MAGWHQRHPHLDSIQDRKGGGRSVHACLPWPSCQGMHDDDVKYKHRQMDDWTLWWWMCCRADNKSLTYHVDNLLWCHYINTSGKGSKVVVCQLLFVLISSTWWQHYLHCNQYRVHLCPSCQCTMYLLCGCVLWCFAPLLSYECEWAGVTYLVSGTVIHAPARTKRWRHVICWKVATLDSTIYTNMHHIFFG